MYAVTGAFYGLSAIILLPTLLVLFEGDRDKLVGEVYPAFKVYERSGKPLEQSVSVNELVNQTFARTDRNDYKYTTVELQNYQDQNAYLTVYMLFEAEKEFYGNAYTTYRLADGKMVAHKSFADNTYQNSVLRTLGKLHFAQYGGYFTKLVYFGLAMLTCFVILSGVMIWLTARQKKIYAPRQKFNTNVAAIYLGACLGLYPAIAFFFCLTKIFPLEMAHRFDTMAYLFFGFWLGYTVYAYFHQNFFKINQHALFLAGAMGLLIPVLNGWHSGLWFWRSFSLGYADSFWVDLAWLCLGGITLYAALRAKPTGQLSRVVENVEKDKKTVAA